MACSSRRLVLIGAANTLDFTETWKRAFEKAKCMPKLIPFPAYRPNEINAILNALRDKCTDPSIFSERAIDYIAKKACASNMGDIRAILRTSISILTSCEGFSFFPILLIEFLSKVIKRTD